MTIETNTLRQTATITAPVREWERAIKQGNPSDTDLRNRIRESLEPYQFDSDQHTDTLSLHDAMVVFIGFAQSY